MVNSGSRIKLKITMFDIINNAILAIVALTMIYPFIYMISVSLSDVKYVMENQVTWWPKGFNSNSYWIVLQDSLILRGYRNTILYTVLGTLISLALTSLTAYALARKGVIFSKPIILMIVFTMLFNGGMIPTFLVVKSLGMLNTIWAMIIPAAISSWNLFVMRTFFQGLPKELEDSAKIDGAGDFVVLIRIVLPLSKPVLATIGLFYAVGIWNNYYSALLYLRTEELYPLQVAIRTLLLRGVSTMQGAGGDDDIVPQTIKFATVIVGSLPILMAYPFIQKYFVKGALIGSVKG